MTRLTNLHQAYDGPIPKGLEEAAKRDDGLTERDRAVLDYEHWHSAKEMVKAELRSPEHDGWDRARTPEADAWFRGRRIPELKYAVARFLLAKRRLARIDAYYDRFDTVVEAHLKRQVGEAAK